jgi:uncharacterized protein YcbK (DUF882 family)
LGLPVSLACLILLGANDSLQTASAEGDTRTLSFHHLHTGETITIAYKRDGRYDDAALKKLDWFMRDWRREESTRMDPKLFDILWEAYREVGGKKPIEVICGYRAPGTNAMLRARSSGVAQNSNHVTGQAMDFAIPGVDLEKLREVGLRLQRGGVGFYPTSGSPFVHMDTGTVRHWPRMTHDQLAKVFPDGRTVHVPSDGKPLPGYALALADVERRGSEPSSVSLAAARSAGVVAANADGKKTKRGLLASLFRGSLDAGASDETADEPQAASKQARGPIVVASMIPAASPKKVAVERVVPLPAARPVAVAQAAPAIAVAALATSGTPKAWNSKIESSDLVPLSEAAPVDAQPPFAVADADPEITASTAPPLAYAEPPAPIPAARAKPMGAALTAPKAAALPAAAAVVPASTTAQAFSVPFAVALSGGVQNPGSPWLRAVLLAPSISGAMTATQLGAPPLRASADLFYKPAQSLVMTFSDDPHLGMTTERFDGQAVEFLATATFTTQMTAALR